jgi:hypothetical protein
LLAEKIFFLAHIARPRWAASKHKTWQGSDVSWINCCNWKWKIWQRNFHERPLKIEEGKNVKTKFSCEIFLKNWKWKIENEAFVPDLLKNWVVKMEPLCQTTLKSWKWKMWKRSFR